MPHAIRKLPESSWRVIISANPHAGARKRDDLIHRLVDELIQRGCDPQVTTNADELTELAQAWTESGDLLLLSPPGRWGRPPLWRIGFPARPPGAVAPRNGKSALKYLEISSDPVKLADIIALGSCVTLDAGQAGERYFLADVRHRLRRRRRAPCPCPAAGAHEPFDLCQTNLRGDPKLPVSRCAGLVLGRRRGGAPITGRWAFVVNFP